MNTGRDLRVILDEPSLSHGVNITGGPLSYQYRITEILLHFGSISSLGSEHTIAGVSFPAEVTLTSLASSPPTNTSQSTYKLEFHGSSFLVTSSWHPRRHARHPREDPREDVGRVGRLPRSACLALTWLVGRRSAAVYSAARLSVCRGVLQSPRARHARLVADILARMLRGCYENAAKKLLSWNLSYTSPPVP